MINIHTGFKINDSDKNRNSTKPNLLNNNIYVTYVHDVKVKFIYNRKKKNKICVKDIILTNHLNVRVIDSTSISCKQQSIFDLCHSFSK